MRDFTRAEKERIAEATNMTEYIKALTPSHRKALKAIMNVAEVERPESLAEYIQRTGCRTEERTSKKGTRLIKVYFENGKVQEYEAAHISTTYAF